jgi:hypothetical protein
MRYRVQYGNYWPLEVLGVFDTLEAAQKAINDSGPEDPAWEIAVVDEQPKSEDDRWAGE